MILSPFLASCLGALAVHTNIYSNCQALTKDIIRWIHQILFLKLLVSPDPQMRSFDLPAQSKTKSWRLNLTPAMGTLSVIHNYC